MTILRPALFILCVLALIFLAWENYDLWWKVPGKDLPEDRNPMAYVVERIPCPEGMGMTSGGCVSKEDEP